MGLKEMPLKKWTHKPVREWPCFVPKCKARTRDWFGDGWWATGYLTDDYFRFENFPDGLTREQKTIIKNLINDEVKIVPYEETAFARDELVKKGIIEASAWTCSYICPEHKDAVIESLATETSED